METTLYDDFQSPGGNFKGLKRPATLELQSPSSMSKKQKFASILTSPDLNMLKLASPELERIIISQNGIITTTPTPTQYLFPKNVTEEQEEYVQGFVHALALLHDSQTNDPNGLNANNFPQFQILTPNSMISGFHPNNSLAHIYTSLAPVSQMNSSTTVNSTTKTVSSVSKVKTVIRPPSVDSCNSNSYSGSTCSLPVSKKLTIKEELQMVPSDTSSMASPPMSPINMEDQEKMKLEKKRYRNRIAASKCRRRKLERISKLEDKVKDLKDENAELGTVAAELREQVCALKQEILHHSKSGCQIMLAQNF